MSSTDPLALSERPTAPRRRLKPEALVLLREAFADHGHHPSSDQWDALEALIDTFDNIVLGADVAPALYLSALDPGVGKTTALIAYVTALLRSVDHRDVGVLICLFRLTEIARLAKGLTDVGGTVAIRTSDKALDALSNVDDPGKAQVLITTQQRLEFIGAGKAFGEIRGIQFRDRPRTLRVWDEAFMPAKDIAVSSDDLAAVLRWLRPKSPPFHRWVEDIRGEAERAEDGEIIQVPVRDFLDQQMTLDDALGPLRAVGGEGDALADRDEKTLKALWSMGGRAITVRKDDTLGPTLVTFARTLPRDLLPLVVLDASGRVRKTYDLMTEARPVVRLPSAIKDYSALTIHVWRRGGGKTSMKDKAQFAELTQVLADLVGKEPEKRWLVVSHKASGEVPDIQAAMGRHLGAQADKVDFITWGNHSATNDHADTDRVILAGTLFLRPSNYEALARASVLKDPDDRALTKEEIKDVTLGEHGHLVLQALCRASVRKGRSGTAASCEAYLVASKRSGIEAMLPRLFPGCTVKTWEPVKRCLPKTAQAALDYLAAWAAKSPIGAQVKFTDVYRALGINQDVFRKQVRGNKDLPAALADLGIVEAGTAKRKTMYTRR